MRLNCSGAERDLEKLQPFSIIFYSKNHIKNRQNSPYFAIQKTPKNNSIDPGQDHAPWAVRRFFTPRTSPSRHPAITLDHDPQPPSSPLPTPADTARSWHATCFCPPRARLAIAPAKVHHGALLEHRDTGTTP